jgi:hypothetical protein
MTKGNEITTSNGATHRSPPPLIVAIVFVALFAASIAANVIMTNGSPYPTPYTPIPQLLDYYAKFSDAIRIAAFLQFGAMMPLGIFAATIVSRLLFHRVKVARVYLALFGGMAAAIFLGVSSLAAWTLSQPGVANETGAMRAIQLFAFATGGFGHVTTLGLFLAGVSVPSLAFNLMPRWIGWTGLILAAICVISVFSMLFPAISFLLPIGRFPAYLWLIAVGFTLPNKRKNGNLPNTEV